MKIIMYNLKLYNSIMTPVGMQVLLELLVCLKTRRHICVEIKKLCFSYCSICVL